MPFQPDGEPFFGALFKTTSFLLKANTSGLSDVFALITYKQLIMGYAASSLDSNTPRHNNAARIPPIIGAIINNHNC
jgi:hypothetical protein